MSNKMIQELNLEDDFLFAKVMADPEICKRVIEKILDIKIKYVEMPSEQKVIDILLDSKSVRLDVYVNDDKGTIYNIEMQQGKKYNLAKRSRYYQGNIDLDLISKGEDYNLLKKSYVIFICNQDPFGKGRHKYTFENCCIEDNTLGLNDETTKIFLNTNGVLEDVDQEMLDFLHYIKHSSNEVADKSESNFVKAINQKVNEVKNDKRFEVEWMTLLERDREKIQEGIEKGIQQGIEQGIGKGIEQEKRTLAKKLMDLLDDQTIADKTELSLEEVKVLRKEVEGR